VTPAGHHARTASGVSYFRLSYQNDIRQWLPDCLPIIKAPVVRDAIRQYLEVIQGLH